MPATKYKTNATKDVPDRRDYIYEPALIPLDKQRLPPDNLDILDQHSEGSCTGFGLAATINYLNMRSGNHTLVSPRMLYEMAKRHDEWPGEEYDGSSIRGVIKGWRNMGVCADSKWPYRKSLLYLVSRAFERAQDHDLKELPLLGMERFHSQVDTVNGRVNFLISSRKSGATQSTTHGGFDNDARTLNHTLKTVLGSAPKKPFDKNELAF